MNTSGGYARCYYFEYEVIYVEPRVSADTSLRTVRTATQCNLGHPLDTLETQAVGKPRVHKGQFEILNWRTTYDGLGSSMNSTRENKIPIDNVIAVIRGYTLRCENNRRKFFALTVRIIKVFMVNLVGISPFLR